MKTFSIMQAQHNFSAVLRELESGHEIGITRRRELVARLVLPENPEPVVFPDFTARARKIWGRGGRGRDSAGLLDETRGER